MTLVELLLSAVVIAMMLGGVTLVSQSLRNDACDQKTRSTLRQLRAALQAYRDQHAAWPTGPATANAVQTLLDDETTAAIVRTLDLGTDPQGRVCIHDGYGRPVRYVVQSRHDTTGSADFVSAGANGRFGDLSSHDAHERDLAADNLYGSDLEMPSP